MSESKSPIALKLRRRGGIGRYYIHHFLKMNKAEIVYTEIFTTIVSKLELVSENKSNHKSFLDCGEGTSYLTYFNSLFYVHALISR